MAGPPNFFVAGPSVNANAGLNVFNNSARNLSNTLNSFQTNWLADPQRKVEEEERVRKQSNERGLAEQAIIAEAGYSKIKPFLENPETQAMFANDPRFANNPEAQLDFVTKLANENQKQFSDHSVLSQKVYDDALSSGMSIAEAQKAADRAVSQRGFSKMPESLAGKLMQNFPASGFKAGSGSSGTSGSGSTSTTPYQSIPGQKDVRTMRNEFMEDYGIGSGRAEFIGTKARLFDINDHDVQKQDVLELESYFKDEFRPETVHATLAGMMEPGDGTTEHDIRPEFMTKQQIEDFRTVATAIENKSNQARGSGPGTAGISLADMQQLQRQNFDDISAYNMGIARRTGFQNNTYEDRAGLLRQALGLPPKKKGQKKDVADEILEESGDTKAKETKAKKDTKAEKSDSIDANAQIDAIMDQLAADPINPADPRKSVKEELKVRKDRADEVERTGVMNPMIQKILEDAGLVERSSISQRSK